MKLVLLLLFVFSSTAMACPLDLAKGRALQTALLVEGLNGGTPLTYEVMPTARKIDSWIVLLSYSGVQKSYMVTVQSESCRITEVVEE